MTAREDIHEVEKIQAKLQEALSIAIEAGFEPNPESKEAGSPLPFPGAITPLVDMAIRQCTDVRRNLEEILREDR